MNLLPVAIAAATGNKNAAAVASAEVLEIELAKGRLRIVGAECGVGASGVGDVAMISLPAGMHIWIAAGVTDLRRGFDGLSSAIQTVLEKDPFSGHVFVFRGRRGDLLKVLWWDGDGLCLLAKRLERGRFARLLEHGAVFADAHYTQFPTVTAIGHSIFLSGATPSVSGIIGNEWFDRASNRSVTSVSDNATLLLGGTPGVTGSSPNRLLVSTVTDELKMADPHSKVISVSVKDRSSVLPGGHMADAAYWFDNDASHFVTSTYYMKELPAWVQKINQDGPTARYLGANWNAVNAKPGDKPFCTMTAGTAVRFCGPIEQTPFSNEILEDFAEKAIQNEQLGMRGSTDVLALSFSANDYVGHAVGPDSPEVRDISVRTDQLLGKLMDFIDLT